MYMYICIHLAYKQALRRLDPVGIIYRLARIGTLLLWSSKVYSDFVLGEGGTTVLLYMSPLSIFLIVFVGFFS